VELTELVAPPQRGRVFTESKRPGLADCAPSGRTRLDALARWLQDVAYADVEDAGVEHCAVWVVRRSRMIVQRFPRFGERFTLQTFCSGFGRMWAERRTTVTRQGADAPDVEAVALWVHLDPLTRRPSPLTEAEFEAYGDAAAGRRVVARLRHPAPPESPRGCRSWTFRATDCDLAGHVNNSAYWQPLEEELLLGDDPERLEVEIEFRSPAQPGAKLVLLDGTRLWIADQTGEVHASIVRTHG
jgi:acyl-ACP thioesterase